MKFQSIKFIFLCSMLSTNLCWSQSYIPVWKDQKLKVKPAVDILAYAFNLADVELLPGPFRDAMNADVRYLLKIEPDRLLADFRSHAGLQPKAKRYGGWESSGLAGHTLGHYLSAVAMHYAHTKDPEFLRRTNYIIDELDACQKSRKSGYLGAIPNEDSMWAQVAKGNISSRGFDLNGAWSPWYTVHKIMSGLLDAYIYADNNKALTITEGLADWTSNLLKNLPDSLIQKMLGTEYGGMNDALVNTYAFTGNKKYLDLSYSFHDRRILDSLAAGRDILPGKHSNTQIPKVIGTARRYQLSGNKKDLATSKFFWSTIVSNHSYATGGNSNYEYLGDPRVLSEKLTDNTTETCNTYNMLKLTRTLFSMDPRGSLMDYYEKALYNHILASQNHVTGMVTYFVPLRMGGRKEYSDEFNSFTCCVGTGMENHVKYGESIYSRGKDGSLYVNLYISSKLNWREKSATLTQESNANSVGQPTFVISTSKPQNFTIRFRKPAWTESAAILVNGVRDVKSTLKDGYLVVERTWKNGDRITIQTPAHFYTEKMPDNPNRQALFYGPFLLAGVLGDKEPDPSMIPVFVTSTGDANQWIGNADTGHLIFHTSGKSVNTDVTLIPFNRTRDEYYSVYWDVFTPAEWAVEQKKYEALKRKKKELEDRTVDLLRVGEMQPERDHEFVAVRSSTGDENGRKWRAASDSGYFAFKMIVDPSEVNTLVCSYWGTDNRGRAFSIVVNDSIIGTEDLVRFRMNKLYDVGYPIPIAITKNQQSVTIKFLPKKNNSAGPVYGIRMAKGDVKDLTTPLTDESIYR
jgi:uncharacterized protein